MAQGARLASLSLALAALVTATSLLIGGSASGLLPAALAFGLTSGLVGSILSYGRRISAFLAWHTLFRRFGRTDFIPKLDRLRPPISGLWAPFTWTAGSLSLAVSLWHPFLWSLALLATGSLLYALEMGWGAFKILRLWRHHRRDPYVS